MIPSRPLSLIEIITETFVTYGRGFWRYAIVALLFVVPGICFVTYGLSAYSDEVIVAARHDIDFSDNDLNAVRAEFKTWLAEQNPVFAAQQQAIGRIDTVATSPVDSLHPAVRVGDVHHVMYYLRTNFARFSSPIAMMIIGILLCVIGVFALASTSMSLAVDVFEERGQDLPAALRASLLKNAWKLLFLYVLYTIATTIVQRALLALDSVSIGLATGLGGLLTMAQIYVGIRCAVAFPALVSEELGPFVALRRSWHLTRISGARILVTSVLFGGLLFVTAVVFSMITGVAFGSAFTWWERFVSNERLTVAWLQQSLPGFVQAGMAEFSLTFLALFGLGPVFLTIFYYDLRTRKDGPLVYVD